MDIDVGKCNMSANEETLPPKKMVKSKPVWAKVQPSGYT